MGFFNTFKCFLRKHDWSDPSMGEVYCYRCGVSYDFYDLRIKSKKEDDEYALLFDSGGDEDDVVGFGSSVDAPSGDAPSGGSPGGGSPGGSPSRGRGRGHGRGRGKGHGKGRGKGHGKHGC